MRISDWSSDVCSSDLLFLRWRARGEDPRYRRILQTVPDGRGWSWGQAALLSVFLTQAPLLFLTCLPSPIGIVPTATRLSPDLAWLSPPGGPAPVPGLPPQPHPAPPLHPFHPPPPPIRMT